MASPLRASRLALIVATSAGAAAAQALQATDLASFHRSGQTFLTYREHAPAANYRAYRSRSPIRTPAELAAAEFLGEVDDRTSLNHRESLIVQGTVHYVIDAAKPPLAPDDGLFVHTTAAAGSFHYAVTRVENGVENTSLTLGQGGNSLAAPVAEVVAPPEPVLQGTPGGKRWYVHWMSTTDTAEMPATANRPGLAYNFSVQHMRPSGGPDPMVVGAHTGGGNYKGATISAGDPGEVRLALDGPPPDLDLPVNGSSNVNTAWFGYNTNYRPGGKSGDLTRGVNVDYTQRRVLATILWVMRQYPVDRNRVYLAGRSMGGVATAAIGFAHPGLFAALHLEVPRFDFSEPEWNLERRNILNRYVPIWGTVVQNIVTSTLPAGAPPVFGTHGEGLGVYDRTNQVLIASGFPAVDLPPMTIGAGKQDCFAGWHEKPRLIAAMEAARQPVELYWQTGNHNVSFAQGPWASRVALARLHRHRLDRSHPAFSGFSQNEDPGRGDDCFGPPSGAPDGAINGRLDWDETTIVDEPGRWSVEVFLNHLAAAPAGTVDVTPRRLQRLPVSPGAAFVFASTDVASGAVVQVGALAADAHRRASLRGVQVTAGRRRLELRPVTLPALELFGDPAPGAPIAFAMAGGPGAPYVTGIAASAAVPPIPTPFGPLGLQPPIVLLGLGTIGSGGAAAAAVTIPDDQALSGAEFHAQALVGTKLTAALRVRIR
jgi:predicted esterase